MACSSCGLAGWVVSPVGLLHVSSALLARIGAGSTASVTRCFSGLCAALRCVQNKKKMSLDDFARINRSTNEGEPMPAALLQSIYTSIARDELKISSGDAGCWQPGAAEPKVSSAQVPCHTAACSTAGGFLYCVSCRRAARRCTQLGPSCWLDSSLSLAHFTPAESSADELPSVFWYQLAVEARRPRGRMLPGARSKWCASSARNALLHWGTPYCLFMLAWWTAGVLCASHPMPIPTLLPCSFRGA